MLAPQGHFPVCALATRPLTQLCSRQLCSRHNAISPCAGNTATRQGGIIAAGRAPVPRVRNNRCRSCPGAEESKASPRLPVVPRCKRSRYHRCKRARYHRGCRSCPGAPDGSPSFRSESVHRLSSPHFRSLAPSAAPNSLPASIAQASFALLTCTARVSVCYNRDKASRPAWPVCVVCMSRTHGCVFLIQLHGPCEGVCVTTKTRHLNRLGQLSDSPGGSRAPNRPAASIAQASLALLTCMARVRECVLCVTTKTRHLNRLGQFSEFECTAHLHGPCEGLCVV